MANKIYLGEIEVANTGGGGGGEGYVSDASFNEMTKVAASALLDLKGLEDSIEEFDEKIEGHVEVIDTQIQGLQTSKADASSVYDKSERDKTDKVAAAAIASLDGRVSALEQGSSFDPTDINSSISDISTRVRAIENDYVVVDDISTFVTQTVLDASYNALDSSIKELEEKLPVNPSTGNYLEYFEVDEAGFYFVDASLNIGVSIDSSGLHAPNLVEYNEIVL